MTSLDIITLNIEGHRQFDRIIPFLKQTKPEVALLQEVFEKDIPYLEKALNMKSVFAPLGHISYDKEGFFIGIATFSGLPIVTNKSIYYRGNKDNLPYVQAGRGEGVKLARPLLITEIVKEDQSYYLINTHFTWTPDGLPSELQHEDLPKMLQILSSIPEFVLCGDFNAPRGGIIFDKIASIYKDNVPVNITTTIDKNLHKAGDLNLVVDDIFTTPKYLASMVKVIDSLSDHCAVSATIEVGARHRPT